VLQFFFAHNLW